jgi:hypothetical protein
VAAGNSKTFLSTLQEQAVDGIIILKTSASFKWTVHIGWWAKVDFLAKNKLSASLNVKHWVVYLKSGPREEIEMW